MSNDINLITKKAVKFESVPNDRLLIILRISSVVSLIVVVFSVLLLFLLRSQSALASLESQHKTLTSQISALHPRAAKYVLIKNRLQYISGLLDKRSDIEKMLSTVLQDIPQDVSISSLSVTKNSAVVTITSASLVSINTIINHFTDLALVNKLFATVGMDTLNFDTSSKLYSVSIKANNNE